jgi:predicted metal-dependent hydrolase
VRNHSRRFWREVERVCPDHAHARRWLRDHSGTLL